MNLGSVLAAEVCSLAGFDWLVIDLEHGGGGEDSFVGQALAAAVHGVPVIARAESAERIRSGRLLDLGAAGIMFPRLETAREVESAIRHLRYPPDGDRGVATYNRSRGFGMRGFDVGAANDEVVGVVQIETAGSLTEVEAIARIPGVDVLFVGPSDLSHALGVPGQLDAPVFRDGLARVTGAAHAAGICAGILAPSPERARQYREEGFTFLGIASDSALLGMGARAAASALEAPAQDPAHGPRGAADVETRGAADVEPRSGGLAEKSPRERGRATIGDRESRTGESRTELRIGGTPRL
jgi:2-dehydro-3-deoxyglucarate aldolase/4-hydroxy-2-oxoheptanedioate aldolase